jgi:hypothetical protein
VRQPLGEQAFRLVATGLIVFRSVDTPQPNGHVTVRAPALYRIAIKHSRDVKALWQCLAPGTREPHNAKNNHAEGYKRHLEISMPGLHAIPLSARYHRRLQVTGVPTVFPGIPEKRVRFLQVPIPFFYSAVFST